MLYKFNKKKFKYTPVNEVKYFYSIVFGTIGIIHKGSYYKSK